MAIDLTKLFSADELSDKKLRGTLLKALKENFLKDFDYLKFRQSVHQLQAMDLDEKTSFKSAFATATTMGFTKAKLNKTAQHYLNVLDKEKRSFAEALNNQVASKVDAKKIKTTEYQKAVKTAEEKIKQLQNEIENDKTKITNIDQEIENDQLKINETRDKFLVSFDNIYESIRKDVGLIDEYL